jgi:hypothetical protein
MDLLPPIVLECPECGEKYLVSQQSETPSEKATLYSDGFFVDDINWRTPLIIGCVTCELGFFTEQGKLIAEPGWDEFQEQWGNIKKAEPPTAGALALELRVRKNMGLKNEIALRTEFWFAGNHTETGRLLKHKNDKFKKFWLESLSILESIIVDTSGDDLILKAEMNRHLGNFDKCVAILKGQSSTLAIQIIENAMKGNNEPFINR